MLFKIRGNKDAFLLGFLIVFFNVLEYFIPSRVTNYAGYLTGALTFIALIEVIQFIFKQYGLVFFFFLMVILLVAFQYGPHMFRLYIERPYIQGVYIGFVVAIFLRFLKKAIKKITR